MGMRVMGNGMMYQLGKSEKRWWRELGGISDLSDLEGIYGKSGSRM